MSTLPIVCPDDFGLLGMEEKRLVCSSCLREFPLLNEKTLELLPREPLTASHMDNKTYWRGYREEFFKNWDLNESTTAWGAPERVPSVWAERRLRQANWARGLLAGSNTYSNLRIICDVSAGAGYYTFHYAKYFDLVIHCDLAIDSLAYCIKKAETLGIDNIIFLRVDYFRLPFQHSLPNVVCFDTLIRGEEHEKLLLLSLRSTLGSRGVALVDFHSWWHNPLRRMGLLPQNFHATSYTKNSSRKLLQSVGIHQYDYFRFHQEVDTNRLVGKAISMFVPPTRLVYRFAYG
jgi:SAM-dependent methyltransferase